MVCVSSALVIVPIERASLLPAARDGLPGRNAVHASDSAESARREIALWFREPELVDWAPADYAWVYE